MMKSWIIVALMAVTAVGQTSRPTEPEFQLWKPTEVGKQLDEFIETNVAMSADLSVVATLLQEIKTTFDAEKKAATARRCQAAHDRYSTAEQSKAIKAAAKRYGIEIDGVYFYYGGAEEYQTDIISKTKLGHVRYWNSTDREILGMRVESFELTNLFGDVTPSRDVATLSGTPAGAVDSFEYSTTAASTSIAGSMKTTRLTAIKARIIFKPKSD